MIELRDVGVRYRRPDGATADALTGIDLIVGRGEVVGVIGPSGCGKSTLLRALAGLEPLSTGAVLVEGHDLARTPTHERGMGLMFQAHALFPHLDVAGNVGFGLASSAPAARAARVSELLDLVGLPGIGDRRVDQLSGGEAQRVALARALAPSPRILMLDEPLGSLDRALRSQLTVELRRLINQLEVTAIHVTHDQAEANELADRIVVLRDGEIQQVGAPAELWHRPASVFVADFLGHQNLWPRGDKVLLAPSTDVRAESGTPTASAMSRVVRVEQVSFVEGRYRIRGRSEDDHPGEVVVLYSDAAPPTETMTVSVRSVVELPSGGGSPSPCSGFATVPRNQAIE